MATKKLQILDYKIKQADNANTVGGHTPEYFATAADMTAMQDAMTDVQSKVGDTSVSEQITTGIANKVDKVDGKGLSTNDYTTAEKNKLAGIASGAEVNQNAFSNVVVGSTTIAADGKTDTLTLVAGDNVTLTPDATNDKVTITAKDTVYTHPSYTAKSAGLYKVTVDATGHVSATTEVTKSDITALGIPGQDTNTTYSVATTSADGLMSASDKTKLDGIATGANKTVVDSALSSTSTNPVQNKVINTEISSLKTLVGDTAVSTQISNYAAPKEHSHAYIPTSQKGAANGVAELDSSGKVPAAQLPSYVDDVLEYTAKANFPATGEAGKIYVDTTTNLTYRWSGSGYTEISPSLALGTTSSTAFRGDYGNTAYAHATAKGSAFAAGLYKITTNDQGHVTAATAVTKADITGLGIPAQDTTYGVATTSANGLMSASDKTKLDGIATGANKTVIDSALSTTSTNPVQNKIVTTEINSLKTLVGDTSVSSQISTAIANKSDTGHTHDDRYYTESEIDNKLSGKSDTSHTHSSYVNQNAFSNVVVGSTTVAADTTTDTLTLVAGSNVTLTPDATNDKITIAATDTTYSNATTSAAGLMSSSDKSKLDGIAAGATKTVVDSALSSTSANPVQNKVVSAAIDNLTSIVGDTPIPTQVMNAIDEMAVQVDLSGAPAGSASTNNADTLGGKTLAQIESQISNATTCSTSRTWTVTVPDSGWVADSLTFMGIACTYKNVVSVVGMTSDVSIDLVKYNSGDVTAARSYICQDTGSGTVTFWAKSALATFSVKLTEVR